MLFCEATHRSAAASSLMHCPLWYAAATYSGGSSGAPAPAPSYSTGTASTQYLTGEDTAGPAVAGTGGTPTTVSSVSGATANGGS